MARKNNVATEVVSNDSAVVEVVKTTILPLDGSGAEKYIADNGGVSKAIRALEAAGVSRGDSAKMLNKRYQHIRNVLITPIKKAEATVEPKIEG